MKKRLAVAMTLATAMLSSACAPEVGSKRWCEKLEAKPAGDWSMNEASDYAKNCLFRQESATKRRCEKLAQKPKGEWTMNEAGDYAKNCVLTQE